MDLRLPPSFGCNLLFECRRPAVSVREAQPIIGHFVIPGGDGAWPEIISSRTGDGRIASQTCFSSFCVCVWVGVGVCRGITGGLSNR